MNFNNYKAAVHTYMSRFARIKNCDFSRVAKNRKCDDFSRKLRFCAVLFHVNNH